MTNITSYYVVELENSKGKIVSNKYKSLSEAQHAAGLVYCRYMDNERDCVDKIEWLRIYRTSKELVEDLVEFGKFVEVEDDKNMDRKVSGHRVV